jgi:hypothetical protein
MTTFPAETTEIRSILAGFGYDPNGAEKLVADGIGPEEARQRASDGSLTRTHGIEKIPAI